MEIKYRYRETNTPYYFEKEILNLDDKVLIGFEIYDGNKVRWGLRETTISSDKSFSNTTLLFDNVLNRYGKDEKRILCLDKDGCVFRGRINNSDVLGRTNNIPFVKTNFLTIEDFGGSDVRIEEHHDNIVIVRYKENDIEKCVFYDFKTFTPCSTVFDKIYANNCFLKSYQKGEISRIFLGRMNYETGEVKPIGFDINKREFINFPLKDGMIDEEEMANYLAKDDYFTGFHTSLYRTLNKLNLIWVLTDLNIAASDITNKLVKLNSNATKK